MFSGTMVIKKNNMIREIRLRHLEDTKYWENEISRMFEYKNVVLSDIIKTSSLISDYQKEIRKIEPNPGPYVRTWSVYQYNKYDLPPGEINHRYSGFIDYYGDIHVFGYDWLFI